VASVTIASSSAVHPFQMEAWNNWFAADVKELEDGRRTEKFVSLAS
jgi:hypothetical protein